MNHDEWVAAYTAPGRHYHNLKHIEDCLGALAGVQNLAAAGREILTEAIWWHDLRCDQVGQRRTQRPAR
jgi:predicted metal-dependent HD superfamily phosphohydrolase